MIIDEFEIFDEFDAIAESKMDDFLNNQIRGCNICDLREKKRQQELMRKLAYIKLGLKKGIIHKEGMLSTHVSYYQNDRFTHNLNGINLAFYGDDERVIEAADILKKYKDKIWGLHQAKGTLSIYANDKFEISKSENIRETSINIYSGDCWSIWWYLPKQIWQYQDCI